MWHVHENTLSKLPVLWCEDGGNNCDGSANSGGGIDRTAAHWLIGGGDGYGKETRSLEAVDDGGRGNVNNSDNIDIFVGRDRDVVWG